MSYMEVEITRGGSSREGKPAPRSVRERRPSEPGPKIQYASRMREGLTQDFAWIALPLFVPTGDR